MVQKTTNQQMSLEEFKKQAEEFLSKECPNFKEGRPYLQTRIEEDSEEYWEDNWSPQAMMAGMISSLI